MTTLTRMGLRALGAMASSNRLDHWRVRKPMEHMLYHGTRAGFKTVTTANRMFKAVTQLGSAQRLPRGSGGDLFDLSLDDDQAMLQEAAHAFAIDKFRAMAAQADVDGAPPAKLMAECGELGLTSLGIPEALGGMGTQRCATTHVLIAEALAEGDMGLALAALAPAAVSTALAQWGSATQQSTYLSAFAGEHAPAAALAMLEPTPLFDPFALQTTAHRAGHRFVLDGVKAMVPLAASAELFLVAAEIMDQRHGDREGPALFLVESSTPGLTIEADPPMGLRAAGCARLRLQGVSVPGTALLGHEAPSEDVRRIYTECVHLSRLAWCAMATGCSQAVLKYVSGYVNDRSAFGEAISHRQSVAFAVANMGIDLESMRLLTWRASSLADAGEPFFDSAAWARRLCMDKAMQIGSDGVQLLGGHGFVKDHPVERWYRDLRAVGVMEGALLV